MTTVKEFKIFLKALINSCRNGRITAREIKKELEYRENIDIEFFVKENGHRNLLELISEWDEFFVDYKSYEPTVQNRRGDHISAMNKFSKQKRGTVNSVARKVNNSEFSQHLKLIHAPDPYSFSPDSSINDPNLPKSTEFNDNFSTISFDDDDFNELYNIKKMMKYDKEEIANKTSDNFKNDEKTLTNESKEVATKEVSGLKLPRSRKMIPSTSKSVNQDSVISMQINKTPKQKLSAYKGLKSPSMQFKLVKAIDKLIPSPKAIDPSVDDGVISIVVQDTINPHRFWFAEYSDYKATLELMNKMNEFYTAHQDSVRIDVLDVQRGLYVAALFGELWHRGMIVKKCENSARVYYVDFGTTLDVNLIDVCYLKEDFFDLPCAARRGVLAFVQPTENDMWSAETINFFKDCIKDKKLSAKIFQHNFNDISYDLSLKYKNEQKKQELLTNSMISNNFAKLDSDFLQKRIVSQDSFKFSEYEEGILLDIKPLEDSALTEAFDSWMPFDGSKICAQEMKQINTPSTVTIKSYKNSPSGKRSADKTFQTPVEKNETSKVAENMSSAICAEIKRNLTNEFNNVAEHEEKQVETQGKEAESLDGFLAHLQHSRSILTDISKQEDKQQNRSQERLPTVKSRPNYAESKNSKQWTVKTQSFEKLTIGNDTSIYIHAIYDVNCFYFYVRNEMTEIKSFLDNLNTNYTKSKEKLPAEELIVGKEVVIYNDDNYCRGRINSQLDSSYQVFLIDFGVFVMKKGDEIYRLQKEFIKRQNCIFKGSLQQSPTKNRSDLTQKLTLAVARNFVDAKIMGILNEDTVDLKLRSFDVKI